MRLSYIPCGLEITISEGGVSGICLENSQDMQTFLHSMWSQSNGGEGEIYLSEGDKSIRLDKDVRVVWNPFSVDLNEKKILSKLWGEMQEIAEAELYVHKSELNAAIILFLEELNQRIPYPLSYSLDLDIQQLLKEYEIKIDMQSTCLNEQIVNYMKLSHQILGINLFVFWHLKDYLSVEELESLYEMVAYEQISVVLLESRVASKLPREQWWIVDDEHCIIEI